MVVADHSTPVGIRSWLGAVANVRGWTFVESASARPGAVWNGGIAASASDVVICITVGDVLDRDFVKTAASLIESADVVATPNLLVGPGSEPRAVESPTLDAAPFVLTRTLWSALGGFDADLPSFEDLDLLCRARAAGRRDTRLQQPLVVRPYHPDAIHVRAWQDPKRSETLAAVLARHADGLGNRLVATFQEADAHRANLRAANDALLTRRAIDVAQLESLQHRAGELRALLSDALPAATPAEDVTRTTPVSRDWGYDRGGPVDRIYIEQFLGRHAADIAGAVLEVQEPDYTLRFGGDKVTRSDVVDLDATNPRATVLSDLRCAANIRSETFDCVILTQTLHVIDDMVAVAAECARILKPGGVLLATLPSASRVCVEYGYDGDFWRVTEAGARHLFAAAFPHECVETGAVGNVRTNAAFLYGLGSEEVTAAEYRVNDPYHPLLITVRATKPGGSAVSRRRSHSSAAAGDRAILLYHRVASPDSDVHGLAVPPQEFRAQMAHLRDRYRPMPLLEFADAAARNALPPGAVSVTFDDGYLDNYITASPILTDLGIPATFFVTSDQLDSTYHFWWDDLEQSLLGAGTGTGTNVTVVLPEGARDFDVSTPALRRAAHDAIYDAIVGAPADLRDRAMKSVCAPNGSNAASSDARRMNGTEMASLARRPGHAIGAHTVRHLMLTRQPAGVRRQEIEECRRTLESLISGEVTAFAYPFGAHDTETRDAVRAAGFRVALACDDQPVISVTDPLAFPRLDPAAARGGEPFDDWLRRRFENRPSASGR